MTDRPIIFSVPMVRALLDGRKTQTRRLFRLPTHTSGKNSHRIYEHPKMGGWEPTTSGGSGCFTIARDGSRVPYPERVAIWHKTCGECIEAPWQAYDRLWVREAWHAARSLNRSPPRDIPRDADIEHAAKARGYAEIGLKGKLRPGIFLPRWASRLTLTVTDVRVQQLQEISEVDAIDEGAMLIDLDAHGAPTERGKPPLGPSPRRRFEHLWRSLHGPDAWSANPWVVALTFTVEQRNIDASPEFLRG